MFEWKWNRFGKCATTVLSACFFPLLMHPSVGKQTAPISPDWQTTYGTLPLRFELNEGQADRRVKFLSRGAGCGLFLTENEAVLSLMLAHRHTRGETGGNGLSEPYNTAPVVLRMQLVGANAETRIAGLEELPERSNYFLGKDPSKWRHNVSNFAKVRYEGVYPGIDLVFYGSQRQLEFDFIIAPRARPSDIRLSFSGPDQLFINGNGDLVASTAGKQIFIRAPVFYQNSDHVRRNIRGEYVLLGANKVGFEISGYDTSKPLVVDPVIVYSTYLGGADRDQGTDIAVDSSKNVYIVGTTFSPDFPQTNSIQGSAPLTSIASQVFIVKLNAAGSDLLYSTYLGGDRADVAGGIAVDSFGNAYITGRTSSPNFPVTPGGFQTSFGGDGDAFVVKLNPTGSVLLYSTFLGGAGFDSGEGIAVDGSGNAYVTGSTESTNFPVKNPFSSRNDRVDAFVAKLNPSGSGLVYSTYLGGHQRDTGRGIAVDAFGNAYVTGETISPDFPTVNAVQPILKGDCSSGPCSDVFVAKFDPQGASLLYSTYLGGDGEERGARIAVDSSGAAYVTGFTSSTKFPTTPGVWQGFLAGLTDVFVAKLSSSGSLLYSTYLGGLDRDEGTGIAVDSAGNAYVTGFTTSTTFPRSNAVQSNLRGPFDVFITKLNATGSSLLYSTYLGGSAFELNPGVAVDIFGNAYVTGLTSSPDFPTVNPFQTDNKGGTGDVFVTKISETEQPVCTLKCSTTVPTSARPTTIVSFKATAISSPCSGPITFEWNFGDSPLLSSEQNPSHIYSSLGSYTWTMTARVTGASPCTKSGTIVITNPSRRQP